MPCCFTNFLNDLDYVYKQPNKIINQINTMLKNPYEYDFWYKIVLIITTILNSRISEKSNTRSTDILILKKHK